MGSNLPSKVTILKFYSAPRGARTRKRLILHTNLKLATACISEIKFYMPKYLFNDRSNGDTETS